MRKFVILIIVLGILLSGFVFNVPKAFACYPWTDSNGVVHEVKPVYNSQGKLIGCGDYIWEPESPNPPAAPPKEGQPTQQSVAKPAGNVTVSAISCPADMTGFKPIITPRGNAYESNGTKYVISFDGEYHCNYAATEVGAKDKKSTGITCARPESILREIDTSKNGVPNFDIRWYQATLRGVVIINGNMTRNLKGQFRNPTISHGLCMHAEEVNLGGGKIEVRVYDFGMNLLSKISDENENYGMPEFGPGDKLYVVRLSDSMIMEFDWRGNNGKELGVFGKFPHSIKTANGTKIAFSTLENKLAYVSDNGDIRETNLDCDRPKWTPDGESVVCRLWAEFALKQYSVDGEIRDDKGAFSLPSFNPANTGQEVVANSEGMKYITADGTVQKVDSLLGIATDYETGAEPSLNEPLFNKTNAEIL